MRRPALFHLRLVLVCAAGATACAGSPIEAMGPSSVGSTSSGASLTTSTHGDDPSTTAAMSATQDGTGTTASEVTSSDPASDATSSSGASASASDGESSSSTGDVAACRLLLDEVFNDPEGEDDSLEWVELYNPCGRDIDLAGFSLGWGGESYADALDLVGTIGPGECFVVGGPTSGPVNADPVFDQSIDFSPDLQNTTNGAADAVALFDVSAIDIDVDTLPIDAVIYGDRNSAELPDETGTPGVLDVPAASAGQAYARIDPAVAPGGDAWEVTATPSPGTCPNPPPT